jgi:type 1 glutamine amidotransferase
VNKVRDESKPNVLLIGDLKNAAWHPLETAGRALEEILQDEFRLTITEEYNDLAALDDKEFPLCISYTDCWKNDLTPRQIAGLLRFVAGGGSLLVIHNGISLQRSFELTQMIGARFTGHPPYQPLSYYGTVHSHPLLEGVQHFTMDEEPYMFDFDPFTKKTVFLEFEFEGKRYPAGWELDYGLGKVIYLQPGHNASSFESESYRRLLLNSALWATNKF